VELMRGQTIVKGNKRKIKYKFKCWTSIVLEKKVTSTIFHVQITSQKYCTQNSGTISDMCLIGSGPKFQPNETN